MKCICTNKCFIAHDGHNTRFNPGQVVEFEECPNHFNPIGGDAEIDFATAGEEELLVVDFELSELKDFISHTFGQKAGNKGKVKTIELLLDCRDRAVPNEDIMDAI